MSPVVREILTLEASVVMEHVLPTPDGGDVPAFVRHVLDKALVTADWSRDGTPGETAIAPGPISVVLRHDGHTVLVRGEALTEAILDALEHKGALRPASTVGACAGYRDTSLATRDQSLHEQLVAMASKLAQRLLYGDPSTWKQSVYEAVVLAYHLGAARPLAEATDMPAAAATSTPGGAS